MAGSRRAKIATVGGSSKVDSFVDPNGFLTSVMYSTHFRAPKTPPYTTSKCLFFFAKRVSSCKGVHAFFFYGKKEQYLSTEKGTVPNSLFDRVVPVSVAVVVKTVNMLAVLAIDTFSVVK